MKNNDCIIYMKYGHIKTLLLGVALILILLTCLSYYAREGLQTMNYMDGVDVIYYINLERSSERRTEIESVLSDSAFNNIPKHRINATDGKVPAKMYESLGEYTKQPDTSDYEYACLISHLDAIKEFNKSEHKIALVLEDDASLEFKKYWRKSIKDVIKNAPTDWELITLYHNCPSGKNFNDKEYEKHVYKKYAYTLAYIINKNGAHKFISSHIKNNKYALKNRPEHIADVYLYENIKTYVYKYPFFVMKSNNDSEIHSDHINNQTEEKNNCVRAYNNIYPSVN
jgi:GR25 family glycosyltransferase involved in LPS biosynthesis